MTKNEHPFDRYAPFTDVALLKEFSDKPLRKSMRVNPLKSSIEAFTAWGMEKKWQVAQVPWCKEGFYIDRDDRSVALGKDLLHLLGHVYMQEAASMLPVELLNPQPGETILDMSAAPGSKTTQIAGKLQGKGVIICNDVQEKRLWTLKAALHRAGVTNYIVTKKVGQWFMRHMTERFDRVLCDAPCTAQGTARKDSDALTFCSLENIGKMSRLQQELLESAIHATKVGGRIVYSTCTLTPEENEGVVMAMLRKFPGQVEVVDPREEFRVAGDELQEVFGKAVADSFRVQDFLHSQSPQSESRNLPLLRLWPQSFDTEGFFCAVLRKTARTRDPEKHTSVRFQEELLPRTRAKGIAEAMQAYFGTSFIKDGECFFLRGNELLLSTDAVADFRLPVQDYSLGLPYGLRLDATRVRMHHEVLTLRGNDVRNRVLDLAQSQLDALLDGKDAECPPELSGDILLRYRNIPVGFSLARGGKLKNRLPRWIVQKS